MFRYINMPRLVAHYLRDFSIDSDYSPSILYRFVYCLCLPFVSTTFARARLIALAIAECTNSRDQISRLLNKITGASLTFVSLDDEYMMTYDETGEDTEDFPYDDSGGNDAALVPYTAMANSGVLFVTLNGAARTEVEGYLQLLIPFYLKLTIEYQ